MTLYYTVGVGSTCEWCGVDAANVGDHCYACLAEHFTCNPEQWPAYKADALETPNYGEHDVAEIQKRMTQIADKYLLEGAQS